MKTETRSQLKPLSLGAGLFATALLLGGALPAGHADTAYGTLSNFDTVNDTGQTCYGFEIELEDIHSSDVTYTYDWNHYGRPTITEDNSNPAHPRVFVRHESKRNPDGSFAAFTNPVSPDHPLGPTDGHACTNPSVNFGCEHFGVGLYRQPSAVRYHWLVEDPLKPGTLTLGPVVSIAMPTFVYYPAPQPAAPAQVVVVIEPPEPPEPLPEQFGPATWVKVLKTVQPRGHHVKLGELLTDDEEDPDDENWEGEEAAETEIEWMVFQKRPANDPDQDQDEIEGADELPEGDEQVTRRYEFYVYQGPVNPEDGEAQCDNPDDCPDAVGAYIGAQMVGFNVEAPLGLIDHLQEGEVQVPYTDRTVVVGGNTPYTVAITDGALPDGLFLDPATGILSGTPTVSGRFTFTVHATDADEVSANQTFQLDVLDPLEVLTADLPAGKENQAYQTALTAGGGAAPYTFRASALPGGLELSLAGVLAGTPTPGTAGQHTVEIELTDTFGHVASRLLQLTIAPVDRVRGDMDGDQDADSADLAIVVAARNTDASGPDDPRDLDKDGRITVRDARILAAYLALSRRNQ